MDAHAAPRRVVQWAPFARVRYKDPDGHLRVITQGKSPVRECRTPGSVRGASRTQVLRLVPTVAGFVASTTKVGTETLIIYVEGPPELDVDSDVWTLSVARLHLMHPLICLQCKPSATSGANVALAANQGKVEPSGKVRVVSMPRLTDKVVLITGAARGIGLAMAQAMIAEGARVLLTDIRAAEGAAEAAKLGARAAYATLDVRDEQAWMSTIEKLLATWGVLDVLVNNAGITGFEGGPVAHDPEHASLDAWRAVHETNLDGVFLGCKHAIRAMRARGQGSIINISSRSGLVGIPGAAAYAASKAAVRNHSKTVALYCAAQGLKIRCNSVHPAAILTPMWEHLLGTGEGRETRAQAFVRDTPLRRFGTVEEVAAAAVYLAADESAYMTGAELVLDGGLLAGSAAIPAS